MLKAIIIGVLAAFGSSEHFFPDEKQPLPSCSIESDFCKDDVFLATQKGLTKDIIALGERDADFDAFDELGRRPLHVAAVQDDISVMEALIKSGAQLNSLDTRGFTALHMAAMAGREARVALLRKAGANLEIKDALGNTALHIAALKGFPKVIEALTKKDGSLASLLNAKDKNGLTPIHSAALNGQEESLIALLEAGADINEPNNWDEAPIFTSIERGYPKITDILNRAGADITKPNKNNISPLQLIRAKAEQARANFMRQKTKHRNDS